MKNKLLALREEFLLTQKEIAEKVGITTSHYGMIELGVRNPSLITARKLAVFFNTTIENIFFQERIQHKVVCNYILIFLRRKENGE